MKCPACSAILPDNSSDCQGCGVNFEKWRARRATGAYRNNVERTSSGFLITFVILVVIVCAAGFLGYKLYRKTAVVVSAAPAAARRSADSLKKALAEARASGDLSKIYSGGMNLEQILQQASNGQQPPSLDKAMAEAETRGDLDKTYSDGVTFRQILEEAKRGTPGEGIEKILAGARARGDLDTIKVQGKSLSQYLSEAEDISRRADEMSRRNEAEQDREMGTNPSDREPGKVVPELIRLLEGADLEGRLEGAQMLCDLRYAANAKGAVPALEAIVRNPGPGYQAEEVKEFAVMALKKIRFCDASALCKSKWRKQ